MNIAMIGNGAIGRYARAQVQAQNHRVTALLVRPQSLDTRENEHDGTTRISAVSDLPEDTNLVLECAGHCALAAYGPDILQRGIPVITVSIGALADATLSQTLHNAAQLGGTRLHLASGAIGALDCLRAARVGGLNSVTYTGRKPPQGWLGSPAEETVDLEALREGSVVHFEGSAREAALRYPKNANVAAAVALAGVGFDTTKVKLIADAEIRENIHEINASGSFGSFSFTIRGTSLPDNPKSSALAAMSVISAVEQHTESLVF